MSSTPTDAHRRELRTIFEKGAEGASRALSDWIERPVRLTVGDVAMVDLIEATGILGDPDTPVAACAMGLSGPKLSGQVILVFEDRAGFALVDRLMRQPIGTTDSWGDLERSAAQETTNILGCAFLNALAGALPTDVDPSTETEPASPAEGAPTDLIPGPPTFFHEFAGSLLEFALADQATELERVLVIRSKFTASRAEPGADPKSIPDVDVDLDWTLLFVPTGASLRVLAGSFDQPD